MVANLIGARLGKYIVQSEIGRGGVGVVYRARDPELERDVAIKALSPYLIGDKALIERFRREARLVARLRHPNIVTIHDVGQEGEQPYFVMEFLEGETLAQIIERQGSLPLSDIVAILCQLALALDYAHQHGIIHRDIKPANIMVGQDGHVTLTDFGVVRAAQETQLTVEGTIIGTPRYMSPEQVKGASVEAGSDQYSLAVVAYEMLAGQVPFEPDNPATMLYQIAHEQTPPISQFRPDLPAGIELVLARALSKQPAERFPSATAFVAALGKELVMGSVDTRALAALQSVSPLDVTPRAVERPFFWRQLPRPAWLLAGLAAVLLVALLALAAAGVFKLPEPEQSAAVPTVVPSPQPLPTAQPAGELQTPASPLQGEDAVEMIHIPAGEFMMGYDLGNDYEMPAHRVYLDSFWIDKTEVTNAQFARFVAETGYQTDAERVAGGYLYQAEGRVFSSGVDWQHPQGEGSDLEGLDDYPVVFVSADDAIAFCEWRGARLPTEAEWEKAARGADDERLFPWGPRFNPTRLNYCDKNCPFDWRDPEGDDGYAYLSPVGSFAAGASPYGVQDMAGNVHEWVSDYYAVDFYSNSPRENPTGPVQAGQQVARGSAWNDIAWYIRLTDRFSFKPDYSGNEVGFRCAANSP